MSDDPKDRRLKQIKAILNSVLDAPQEKAHNQPHSSKERNPEFVGSESGFLGEERARANSLSIHIPRSSDHRNGGDSMIQEIESENKRDPSSLDDWSFYTSDEPRSSKIVPISSDIDINSWVPKFGVVTHSHIKKVFSEHPEWKDVIRYDLYKDELVKDKPTPWGDKSSTWTDIDTVRAKVWLSDKFGVSYPTVSLEEVFSLIGHDNKFNSLQEEIKSYEWDGIPRLDKWTHLFLGAEDNQYHTEIGKKFLTSAVARAMSPGCKADHVLILEGKTSARKSSVIEILAGSKNYCDSPIDLNSTFSPAQLVGVWIYELPEMVLQKAFSNEKSKAFLSRKFDDYSPKNVRRKIHQLRTNVFCSTTNDNVYLTDPTGDRRSWPCKVADKIDLDLIYKYRENLIAEALNCFRLWQNGYEEYKWWLDDDAEDLARKEQEKRYMADSWEETISVWLAKNEAKVLKQGYITVSEILWYALKIKPGRAEKKDEMRIAAILTTRFNWRKGERMRTHAGRVYPYYPPNA